MMLKNPRDSWKTCVMIAISFLSALLVPRLYPADVDGKTLVEEGCLGCHGLDTDHEGPRLKGVIGRRAASLSTFEYSKAMQGAKFTWDPKSLDKWLSDPESVVPGTVMGFRVPKPEERAAIIAYLSTLKP